MAIGSRGPYRKTHLRREQIVRDAMEVITRTGVHATTLRDIAEAVGISQTTLLHHFGTKEGLLMAVLEHREEVELRVYADLFVREGVLATVERSLHFSTERPGLPALFAMLAGDASRSASFMHNFFVKRYDAVYTRLEAYLRNDEAVGRARSGIDVTEAAHRIVALSDGLQLQWLLDPTIDAAQVFVAATHDLRPLDPDGDARGVDRVAVRQK